MNFIEELKTRKDLLVNPQGLVAVAGCSLDEISSRIRGNLEYQSEIAQAEQKLYRVQSSCENRS